MIDSSRGFRSVLPAVTALALAAMVANCSGSQDSNSSGGTSTGSSGGMAAADAGAANPCNAAADAAAPMAAEDAAATPMATDAAAAPAPAPDAATAAVTPPTPPAADAGPAPVYSGPPPWINVRPPRVAAGLQAEQITRVFHRHQADMTRCYTTLLATSPGTHGTLNIRMQVIAGGTPIIDRIHLTPHNDATLEGCFRAFMQPTAWPNPVHQPSVEIDMQIDLAPQAPAGPHPAGHH